MSAAAATAEGLELARSLDESLAKILDVDSLLAATAADEPLAAERLATVRELGTGLLALDEAAGGLGIGLGDRLRLAAVFGRRLVPAPLRDEAFGLAPALSALAAADGQGPEDSAAPGSRRAAELLEALVAGELRGGVALSAGRAPEPRGPYAPPPDSARAAAPESASTLLVAALEPGAGALVVLEPARTLLFELEPGAASPFQALDAGQGLARVELGATEPLTALEGPAAASLRREYELALACEAFGAGERALELAAEYAEQRQQFGRPIASFQAVAHLLAEMKLGIETARAGIGRLVDLAAAEEADPVALADWTAVLSHAVPAAARRACEGSIQVHGGIGFSWELGLHLGYRRVLAVQYLLGGEAASAEVAGAAYLARRAAR
ncbi:MAG TPA: acyl-CoA dehydrogenase family protein [Solirubrobacterales bacterium]|nr:acyl-CoA dehydrogenase family protein [Solirubrobacterales bacterium]